jgi:hypothetical protein
MKYEKQLSLLRKNRARSTQQQATGEAPAGVDPAEEEEVSFSFARPFIYSLPLTLRPSSATNSSSTLPIQCYLAMNLDLNPPSPYNQQKPLEHWNHKRSQHWTVYPNFPINTGIVRQKYRDIAKLYDKQQIIHPTVVGFCVRYKVQFSLPFLLLSSSSAALLICCALLSCAVP